jgi:two-component system chemotaxis sensor kinase CheA
VKHRIEKVGNADVVRLRDSILPLVRLSDVLEVQDYFVSPTNGSLKRNRRKNIADRRSRKNPLFRENDSEPEENTEETTSSRESADRRYHAASALNIMIVTTGAMKYGLVVDQLLDSEEIVVKPLGYHLKNCSVYAGATIMGDGRISLILDVANIARTIGLTSLDETDRALEIAAQKHTDRRSKHETQALLVFNSGEDQQFAVPLNQVIRIEKITRHQIETIGGKRAMQYRGTSLPLISIDEVVQVKPLDEDDDLLVLIFILAGHEVGVLASNPVNAMEVVLEIDDRTHRQTGVIGSILLHGTITLLLNVYDIFQAINPQWFTERTSPVTADGTGMTILVVEDSTFFRNQVTSFLESENYRVIEAEDGLAGLEQLSRHHEEISLVITDIEMPRLDGIGLTEAIRKDSSYNRLPVIALTTLAGDKDIARGKAAGVDRYLIKLDKENLMASIHQILHDE